MVIGTRSETFRVLARPSPMVLARPVSRIRDPRAMPAPNSRMVPRSIREAWLQLRVNCRLGQSTGSTNSRPAAMMKLPMNRKMVESATLPKTSSALATFRITHRHSPTTPVMGWGWPR